MVNELSRTWPPRRGPHDYRPLGVQSLECGCWVDSWNLRMWEPCPAHEPEGHVAVIGKGQVAAGSFFVARCLNPACTWVAREFYVAVAQSMAQDHWAQTRGADVKHSGG